MILFYMTLTAFVLLFITYFLRDYLFIKTVRDSYFMALANLSIFSTISLFFRAPSSLLTLLLAVVALGVILKIKYKWDFMKIIYNIARFSVPITLIAYFYLFLYADRMAYQDAVIMIVGEGAGFYFLTLGITLGLTYFFYNNVLTKGFGGARHKGHDPNLEKVIFQRGQEGEEVVNNMLQKNGFTFIHDALMFQKGRKGKEDDATQIDHVTYVGDDEIWVIETKNWSGKINLQLESYDCYVTDKKGVTRTFYNPILQNEKHVRFVKRALERGIGRRKLNKNFRLVNVIIFVGQNFNHFEDDLVVVGSDVLKSMMENGTINSNFENFEKVHQVLLKNDKKDDKKMVKLHEKIINKYKK